MATKTKIPITSEKEDTEKKMTGNLKIVIMNTGGNKKTNPANDKAEKRKQVIGDVVRTTGAKLFLFQEFGWKNINDGTWGDKLPSYLGYIGNEEACILFDKSKVTVVEVQDKTGIQESTQERMCISKVKMMGIVEFICISWHGEATKTLEMLIREFKSILQYILRLSVELKLPVVLGGDFNLKIKDIQDHVSLPLVLYEYPPERRTSENIIDFFISSESLQLFNIKALALESTTEVAEVLSLFDHDPVVSFMSTKPENKDSLESHMGKMFISSGTSDTDTTPSESSAEIKD